MIKMICQKSNQTLSTRIAFTESLFLWPFLLDSWSSLYFWLWFVGFEWGELTGERWDGGGGLGVEGVWLKGIRGWDMRSRMFKIDSTMMAIVWLFVVLVFGLWWIDGV